MATLLRHVQTDYDLLLHGPTERFDKIPEQGAYSLLLQLRQLEGESSEDEWMNQAYSWLSTTHGHITDCKLLVCMCWTCLGLVRPVASLNSASPLKESSEEFPERIRELARHCDIAGWGRTVSFTLGQCISTGL